METMRDVYIALGVILLGLLVVGLCEGQQAPPVYCPKQAPDIVAELRTENAKLRAEVAELRAKVKALESPRTITTYSQPVTRYYSTPVYSYPSYSTYNYSPNYSGGFSSGSC